MPPVQALAPSILLPHPQNPRPRLTEAEVAELRASIQAHGQVQPCVVRPVGENGSKHYQILIFHRRAFSASPLAGKPPPSWRLSTTTGACASRKESCRNN